MEQLDNKVIKNAISSYFLFIVSASFLFSKAPYINHPFVKSHVRVATVLHIFLILVFFIMSYDIANKEIIANYSLNDIVTILLSLCIFAGIFYGAYKAYKGETLTLGDMYKKGTGSSKSLLQVNENKNLSEEQKAELIFCHVPFLGYIVGSKFEGNKTIRDIVLVNLIISCIAVFLYAFGYTSLATILFLLYTIYSVFSIIHLLVDGKLYTLDTSYIPTPKEKYILQKSIIVYAYKVVAKKPFESFQSIIERKNTKLEQTKRLEKTRMQSLRNSKLPGFIAYIPYINVIRIISLNTNERLHILYGLWITAMWIALSVIFSFTHPMLLLLLFPISFGIGHLEDKSYIMPYLYDLIHSFSILFKKIGSIFGTAKKLKNTTKREKITMTEKTSEKPQIKEEEQPSQV